MHIYDLHRHTCIYTYVVCVCVCMCVCLLASCSFILWESELWKYLRSKVLGTFKDTFRIFHSYYEMLQKENDVLIYSIS